MESSAEEEMVCNVKEVRRSMVVHWIGMRKKMAGHVGKAVE